MLIIGKEYFIGWNTAKAMDNEREAYGNARCEAFGVDWAVFRTKEGEPLAATFDDLETFIRNMGD